MPGSAEEVWVQFYNQGVGIFNNPVPTALILAHTFGEKLSQLCEEFDADALQALITDIFRCSQRPGRTTGKWLPPPACPQFEQTRPERSAS